MHPQSEQSECPMLLSTPHPDGNGDDSGNRTHFSTVLQAATDLTGPVVIETSPHSPLSEGLKLSAGAQ